MQQRTLGNSSLEVSTLGLGCMSMTGCYSRMPDRHEMIALIQSTVERGATFFDTAEVYGPFIVVELLCSIAERKNSTPAQIALAWLLAQKPWIVPIPGTRRLERLEENLGAVDIELTADDLRDIESASETITVAGGHYPDHLERMTGL